MTDSMMFHDGNRRLQDQFDSRRISDRLKEKLTRTQFTPDDKASVESVQYFFLATADAAGRPDCSYKGGMPGFVRITGPSELAFPDYDGNGMFKSLGNILVNPNVGILFIAMHGKAQRLRVNGEATVSDRDPLLAQTIGAQLIVRVAASAIFPNCPRYISKMQLSEPSIYAPRPGVKRQNRLGKGSPTSRTTCIRAILSLGASQRVAHTGDAGALTLLTARRPKRCSVQYRASAASPCVEPGTRAENFGIASWPDGSDR